MNHDLDVNQILSSVKSIFPGDDVQAVQKFPSSPFGLASLVNNSFAGDTRVCWLRDGFIDADYIVGKFTSMVQRVAGRKELFIDPEGSDKWLKQRSRWNPDYNYGGAVGRSFDEQVKGLRHISHLMLTFDPKRVESYMPDWWLWGEKSFTWIVAGFLVGQFLEALNKHLRSINRPWSFIAWVLEPHESGFPHVHLMFLGSYIADLAVLVGLWPYSEPNGVRLGMRKKDGTFARGFQAKNLARYLTTYLSKDIQSFSSAYTRKLAKGERLTAAESEKIKIAAFLYFFRRRFFNCRHLVSDEAGKKVWLFARRLKESGRWKKVPHNRRSDSTGLGDDEIDPVEYDLSRDGLDPGDRRDSLWSGNLSSDLKKIASMPVLYPDQIKGGSRGN